MHPNKKYIVVGATGYVGSALFYSIPNNFVKLGTSSRSTSGLFQINLENDLGLSDLPISCDDTVFLASAVSSPDACSANYSMAYRINVVGTRRLIETCIERKARVIFFSSDAVYGEGSHRFTEESQCNPMGDYAAMKHEIECEFVGSELFKSVRLSYVFSSSDRFFRYLEACAKKGEEAEIYHPFCRSAISRRDVVEGLLSIAAGWEKTGVRSVNFGGPELLSRIDMAETAKREQLAELVIKVTTPTEEFFSTRARVINLDSTLLSSLMGRQLTSYSAELRRADFRDLNIRG